MNLCGLLSMVFFVYVCLFWLHCVVDHSPIHIPQSHWNESLNFYNWFRVGFSCCLFNADSIDKLQNWNIIELCGVLKAIHSHYDDQKDDELIGNWWLVSYPIRLESFFFSSIRIWIAQCVCVCHFTWVKCWFLFQGERAREITKIGAHSPTIANRYISASRPPSVWHVYRNRV